MRTVLAPLAGMAALAATPAFAQTWSAEAALSAPLEGTWSMRGDSLEMWDENPGDVFFGAAAYLSETDPAGTACTDADTIEFDIYFGRAGHMELQFLFDAEAMLKPGEWRIVDPTSFYNAGSSENTFAVNIEVFDEPTVTLTSMTCQPGETVDIAFAYDFTGGSTTGKGPDTLRITGTAEVRGIPILSLDD